jgi:hypothetical protein
MPAGWQPPPSTTYNHTIYIPDGNTIVYNYATDVQKEFNWGNYNYLDCSEYGLLLSEFPNKKNKAVKHVNLQNFQETLLDEGSMANWGFDDFVVLNGQAAICNPQKCLGNTQ